jgi:hypothetical protein
MAADTCDQQVVEQLPSFTLESDSNIIVGFGSRVSRIPSAAAVQQIVREGAIVQEYR